VILGGSTGIGLGLAAGMGMAGAELVLVGRSQEKLDRARAWLAEKKVPAHILAGSVTDQGLFTDLDALLNEKRLSLNGVVIAAATYHLQAFPEYHAGKMEEIVKVNLSSALTAAQWAARKMEKTGGSLLFVSSGAALRAMPKNAVYAATKGALRSLARTLAVELARYGIRVNTLIPGFVDTPLTAFAKVPQTGEDGKESLYDTIKATIPMGRWGLPNDFAGIGVWLMSQASSYVTGHEFVIDGGMLVR
jgi:NAD(P)-dependent dehydrogenase (short-subunit alcohol dehydrogenase family)